MDWFQVVDNYCERMGAGYWAEPINTVTNAAFLIAAAVMWGRTRGMARAMVVVLGLIGVGSYLFHTQANRITGVADVVPILAFILIYLFAASRDLLGLKDWEPWIAAAGFFPFAGVLAPLFGRVPGLGTSAGYAPVPVLILIFAFLMRNRDATTARGLAVGAGILIVSLAFRTLDAPLCPVLPIGTHFIWHLMNAGMLAWMIAVYVGHLQRSRRPV